MKKLSVLFSITVFTLLFVIACTQEKEVGNMKLHTVEPVLPTTVMDYQSSNGVDMGGWSGSSSSTDNSINNKVATLGRVLFYDKTLSINNSIACASCHVQQFAFSDGQQFSGGVTDAQTLRNSLAIVNTFRENGFFWDLRETNLQTMVLKPIQNHVEMGFDKMDNVVANVQQTYYYKDLFTQAFGNENVTADKISMALMQFLNSMKSGNSKYDIGKKTNFSNFNPLELLGKELFTQKLYCKQCHVDPDFTASWMASANIGLDLDYADKGLGALPDRSSSNGSSSSSYDGQFKIPSLRNVELTAPYMHDGRFKSLEEVIEHYNSGVKNHPNLSWNLKTIVDEKTGQQTFLKEPIKLNLDDVQKQALIAFLKTLTDNNYVNDVRYSNPFQVKQN